MARIDKSHNGWRQRWEAQVAWRLRGLEIQSVVGRWGRRNGGCVGGDNGVGVGWRCLSVCGGGEGGGGGGGVRLTGTSIAQDLVDLG